MIAYNSAWIDFVNSGDEGCLNYLKADGTAYRKAIEFDKIGEQTQSFESFELGEARVSGDTVYLFVHEEIKIEEGGNESLSSDNLIYRLEKVGKDYKIVNYEAY